MRSTDAGLSGEETAFTASGTTLPHLKGARPTIHAGLLRPVLLNRTRIIGHPGGPPPGRKRRKKHKQPLKIGCVTGPRVHTDSEKLQRGPSATANGKHPTKGHLADKVRNRRDPNHAEHGNRVGCTPTIQTAPVLGHGRCDSPANPSSASCMHTSSVPPDLNCHLDRRQGAEVASCTERRRNQAHYTERAAHTNSGNLSRRTEVRRLRVEDGCLFHENAVRGQSQTDARTYPADLTLVPASGGERRSSVIRFRPATRQDIFHPNSQQRAATSTTIPTTTPKVLAEKMTTYVPEEASGYPRRSQEDHFGPRQRWKGGHIDHHIDGVKNGSRISKDRNDNSTDNTSNTNNTNTTDGNEKGTNRCFDIDNRGDGQDKESDSELHASAVRNSDASVRGEEVSPSYCPVDTTLYHVARCMCERCRRGRAKRGLGPPAPPTFKFVGAEPRLVSATLLAQQFRRHRQGGVARGGDKACWRLLWSSQHLRSHVFRNLKRGQRINSFPRTYECTRKDALSRNMNRMRQVHGARHFNFAPRGFVLPAEREEVREAMLDKSEGEAWIVKPASLACGRGISITNNFADMPVGTGPEGNWIAQRYIENPLLLDGLKFDLRLYVAVTSFRPLRVYMHQEGLCRLATEAYSPDFRTFGNRFIHLTNYSINRNSSRYEPATTGAGEDEDADLRQKTAPSSNHSTLELWSADTEGVLSARRRGLAGGTAGGTRETKSGPTDRISADGLTVTNATDATRGRRSDGNDIAADGGECGRGGKYPCHIDTTEAGNAKEGAVRAESGDRCPSCSEDDDTRGRQRPGEKSSSRSHSRGVRGGRGSKWSLKALRRRLAEMGVNVPALWEDIHSVVIKTLVAIEAQVSAAVELLAIRSGTCFELFGFDVLVDREQKPHLLEVNFAPSLNTDSDLDLDVKSKVVSDLLNLAGIRGTRKIQRPRSSGTTTEIAPNLSGARKCLENIDRHQDDQVQGKSVGNEAIRDRSGGSDDSDDGRRNGPKRNILTAATFEGDDAAVPPREGDTLSKNCKLRREPRAHGGDEREREGRMRARPKAAGDRLEVKVDDQAARPTTKGCDRGRSTCRSGNRRRKTIGSGGGEPETRAVPAWEGSFRKGDGASPSAKEMAAVAMESEGELRRSGGFDLIFPLAGTANKYLKFFDGPRPLERMLAATSSSTSSHKTEDAILSKIAPKG